MNLQELEAYKARGEKRETSNIRRDEEKPFNALSFAPQTLANVPGSALQYGRDVATAILNPIETFDTVTDLGASILSLVPGIKGDATLAKEVGKYYKDRYAPGEIAKTIRDDPVGFLGDLSLLLTGGAGAARLAGKTGKITDDVARVGGNIEPLALLGRGADRLGQPIDFVGDKVVRGVQAAGTGVKRQVFQIAFEDAKLPKNANTAFRRGFKGEGVKDREIVELAEKAYKKKYRDASNKFSQASRKAKLEQIPLDDATQNAILQVFSDVVDNNAGTIRAGGGKEKVLKLIDDDITKILENPNAGEFRRAITRIDELRPSKTGEGGENIQVIVDRILGQETGLRGIFDKLDGLPEEYIAVKDEYIKAMGELKRARQDLGLGKDLKRDTILNNLRRTLAVLDNISEDSLLSLPGGREIRDIIAGGLAKDIIPEQYLRTAGAAGTIGLAGGVTGAGLIGGLGGASTAAALFSPQLATRLNRQAARIRPKVGQFRQSILEPLRQFGTTARPIETIQREVENPLERRGLL